MTILPSFLAAASTRCHSGGSAAFAAEERPRITSEQIHRRPSRSYAAFIDLLVILHADRAPAIFYVHIYLQRRPAERGRYAQTLALTNDRADDAVDFGLLAALQPAARSEEHTSELQSRFV